MPDLGVDPRPAVAGERLGPRNRRRRWQRQPLAASQLGTASRSQGAADPAPRDAFGPILGDKLLEERVRRVVEPLLVGRMPTGGLPPDDIDYVRDLGLVAKDSPVRIANPIYREVVPRQLAYADAGFIDQEAAWYVDAKTGRLEGKPCWRFSSSFSGSTPNIGCRVCSIRRLDRSCCCKLSGSASPMVAGAWSGSTGLAAVEQTC